jgi:large subunit ribosomal protein L24
MSQIAVKSKKIRKGDKVIAIAGNYRGMSGTVLSCSGDKILVQGLNVRKRHIKGSSRTQPGRIAQIEKPIHVSNLKICVDESTPVKLHVRVNTEGERELYYENDAQDVLYRSIKKTQN